MKKASSVFFITLFSVLLLSSCNTAARKAKKCDCPTFGSKQIVHQEKNGKDS